MKSLSILALLGFVTQTDVVQAIQNQHHHHHHQSLAQEEPKAVTPDSNRKVFDEKVKVAAGVVDTQNKTENKYVTQITDIH